VRLVLLVKLEEMGSTIRWDERLSMEFSTEAKAALD
jgi:hypothetical protein